MWITENQVIDLLKSRVNQGKAERADLEPPGTVDTDQDSGLLSPFGIDPEQLLGNLPGGLGDKLGFWKTIRRTDPTTQTRGQS